MVRLFFFHSIRSL